MKILGITGGIGSGKSQVLCYLEEGYRAYACQLDNVAKELQREGQSCYHSIVKQFGTGVIGSDRGIDREKLSKLIFSDEVKRRQLNEIVHPEVRDFVVRDIEKKRIEDVPFYIIEAALLPGAGYEDICGEIWYIYAPKGVRRERLKKSRGYSDEKITAMMKAQPTEEVFRGVCHKVIDNSGFFEDTKRQIGEII